MSGTKTRPHPREASQKISPPPGATSPSRVAVDSSVAELAYLDFDPTCDFWAATPPGATSPTIFSRADLEDVKSSSVGHSRSTYLQATPTQAGGLLDMLGRVREEAARAFVPPMVVLEVSDDPDVDPELADQLIRVLVDSKDEDPLARSAAEDRLYEAIAEVFAPDARRGLQVVVEYERT